MNHHHRFFPPEWHPQDAVLVAWPHLGTDWAYMLDEVTRCYVSLARAIASEERLIILAPDPDEVKPLLRDVNMDHVSIYALPTNDTWTRDYGPIAVVDDDQPRLLDFTFNAWGMKFAADCDNQVNQRLTALGLFAAPVENHLDMVLEGGSIESDGNGTVMTTRQCLLSANRNDAWGQQQIEEELKHRLGARQVIWIDHAPLPGDDTDAHIDTMARFCPDNIVLVVDDDLSDQIGQHRDADGNAYRPILLPQPEPMEDELGVPMPATYANFLITNTQVLMPTYGQKHNDQEAKRIIESIFRGRSVMGIDCRALIKQHGSLHCATMQLPRNTLII